eukprot:TRINITY_DN30620_c0_g2_i4.p1 TRINITY_DN30620_c0_g2~~TRINITY_DN30620_c0_g2_i4.p1  ORF type:complete len:109 (-),score=7.79 TRINITY_DN30620_c0_g2_i4:267-593(-)
MGVTNGSRQVDFQQPFGSTFLKPNTSGHNVEFEGIQQASQLYQAKQKKLDKQNSDKGKQFWTKVEEKTQSKAIHCHTLGRRPDGLCRSTSKHLDSRDLKNLVSINSRG